MVMHSKTSLKDSDGKTIVMEIWWCPSACKCFTKSISTLYHYWRELCSQLVVDHQILDSSLNAKLLICLGGPKAEWQMKERMKFYWRLSNTFIRNVRWSNGTTDNNKDIRISNATSMSKLYCMCFFAIFFLCCIHSCLEDDHSSRTSSSFAPSKESGWKWHWHW